MKKLTVIRSDESIALEIRCYAAALEGAINRAVDMGLLASAEIRPLQSINGRGAHRIEIVTSLARPAAP